jgi:hypothetical protein
MRDEIVTYFVLTLVDVNESSGPYSVVNRVLFSCASSSLYLYRKYYDAGEYRSRGFDGFTRYELVSIRESFFMPSSCVLPLAGA